MSDATKNVWPDKLRIRDTQLHDDIGGAGQRIYTTAGQGYEKREYIRADLVTAEIEQLRKALGDTLAAWLADADPEECGSAITRVRSLLQTKENGFGQFFYTDGENLLAEVSGSDKGTDDPEWDRKHIHMGFVLL